MVDRRYLRGIQAQGDGGGSCGPKEGEKGAWGERGRGRNTNHPGNLQAVFVTKEWVATKTLLLKHYNIQRIPKGI